MPPPSASLPARSKFIYNRASMNRPSTNSSATELWKTEPPSLSMPAFEGGTVWIAGAGPGAAEHLTLGALAALREAEVIVYDALVSAEVLKLARRGAVLEYAGKRGGKPSPKQADITERLIHHARNGVKVLRLKGGDPFVFGRGGEEIAGLIRASVPFRILPGITAATGALSAAGIPLTHRDVNQCVSLVTGHDASGVAPSGVDWSALAKASPVLVFYMALKQLDRICSELLQGGRHAAEPVAFLENATLPEQRLIETTLGEAITVAEVIGLQPPAIFVVGEVVARRLVSSQAPPAVESATESVTESATEKTMPNTYQESASQG